MPTSIRAPRLWYQADGSPVPQADYPEAASQSFKAGDLVILSSGKVTIAASYGSNLGANADPIGVALKDATGTTDTPIPVALINNLFRMVLPVTHATAASAVTAVTQVGSSYEVEMVSGKGQAVAIDDSTNDKVTVTKIHPGPGGEPYAVGEQYGWVEVKFIDAETAAGA